MRIGTPAAEAATIQAPGVSFIDEHMRLMNPDTIEEIASTIIAMLGSKGRGSIPLDPGASIIRDAGFDSLAVMDFVMQLEDKFDVSIPLDVLVQVETVEDLASAIHDLRQKI